jgi:hypothetical protein
MNKIQTFIEENEDLKIFVNAETFLTEERNKLTCA